MSINSLLTERLFFLVSPDKGEFSIERGCTDFVFVIEKYFFEDSFEEYLETLSCELEIRIFCFATHPDGNICVFVFWFCFFFLC